MPPGLFLCASPMAAQQFWSELGTIKNTGVTVSRDIASEIAPRWNCHLALSSKFQVIGALNGWAVKVTDGIKTGWVVTEYYAMYSQKNLVRQ